MPGKSSISPVSKLKQAPCQGQRICPSPNTPFTSESYMSEASSKPFTAYELRIFSSLLHFLEIGLLLFYYLYDICTCCVKLILIQKLNNVASYWCKVLRRFLSSQRRLLAHFLGYPTI
uniref:Uncharacterized protein n=1 Tax=Glossina brevipalpis TaxID=37001 RepID=A0A1A9WK92_9MUSC